MKKRLGLLVLASATLLIPSCGRKLYRKVASQLVATYQQFNEFDAKTIEMVKQVDMSWNYNGTSDSEIASAQDLVRQLTGEEKAEKTGSISLTSDRYIYFFETVDTCEQQYKEYKNNFIKWNLCSSASVLYPEELAPKSIPVFDLYFPENKNYDYSAKINDLYVSGPMYVVDEEDNEEILVGRGSYHYDNYGRIAVEQINFDMKGEQGNVRVSLTVHASYNPIKK